jgi:pimeloyl-ACP methyl ester carboxylesterase
LFVILATLGASAQTALGSPGGLGEVPADVPAAYYLKAQRLIEIEPGRRLNLFCLGHGKPTVLLNAGLGDSSLVWRRVQGTLSKSTRVCSFDRAGYGFSDPARSPPTVQSAVDDMAALISHGGLGSPVILVAHSLGGMQALLFAFEKPRQLAGLVLIDPAYPGQPRTGSEAEQIRNIGDCLDAARAGSLAQADPPASLHHCLDYPANPDPLLHRELDRQDARVQNYVTKLAEAKGLHATDDRGRTEDARILDAHWRSLGAMPLTVLSAGTVWPANASMTTGQARAKWAQHIEGHRRLAALSTRGKLIVVPHTTHYIQRLQPQAVVRAVAAMLAVARAGGTGERGRLRAVGGGGKDD